MKPKLTKSEAKKLYWSTIPKEEKIKKARMMAKKKSQNMTYKERHALAMKMVKAKKDKAISINKKDE